VARHIAALLVAQGDSTGDAVGPVPGDFDRRFPTIVPIDPIASFLAVDGIAERPRRTVPDGPDDLVHPASARRDEGLLVDPEDGGDTVGAEARVLTRAPVVEGRPGWRGPAVQQSPRAGLVWPPRPRRRVCTGGSPPWPGATPLRSPAPAPRPSCHPRDPSPRLTPAPGLRRAPVARCPPSVPQP